MEGLGKRVSTFALGALVLLLSAVFALQFGGPQAEGCGTSGPSYAAKVYGTTLTEGDFRAAYRLAGFDRAPPDVAERRRLKEATLDGLVERTLLAREARRLGFTGDEAHVTERLQNEATVFLSLGVESGQPSGELRVPVRDTDEKYDAELAERFVKYGLQRSIGQFLASQVEEALAQQMRDSVLATVTVSPREVWEAFVRESDRARISYLRFSRTYYRETLEPTPDQLQAWTAKHQKEIDDAYQARKHQFEKLEPQVRARHILIRAVGEDAEEGERDQARARAQRIATRAKRGENFAALAREASEDVESGRKGGDLGFIKKGQQPKPFEEALFSLGPGEVSGLVETDLGWHVIQAVQKREGDVPEEEAKAEIAEGLFRDAEADVRARDAATTALESLRSGTALEEIAGAFGEGEDSLAPAVEESSLFGRGDQPLRTGNDGPLVHAAFELRTDAPHPAKPLQLGQDWYVFRLDERQRPAKEDFTDEAQTRLRRGLMTAKERDALGRYIRGLRREAAKAQAVSTNPQILRYREEDREESPG